MEDWKIKISVLWLIGDVIALSSSFVLLLETGVLERVIAGEMQGMQLGPETLLLTAVLFLVPLVMAFLSLTMKDSANRWANIVLGIVYTGLQLWELTYTLAQPSAWAMLMDISKVVAPALIIWYAWKSERKA